MSAISLNASSLRRFLVLPLLALYILSGVLIVNVLYFLVPRTIFRRFIIAWMGVLLRLLRIKIILHGRFEAAPVLIVANHVSWLDIPVLLVLLKPSIVSKKELKHWPLIGKPAEKFGTLFLARGDSEDTRLLSNQIAFLLTQRKKIAVFPEGTTTNGRTVQRFYPRLFQAAIYAKAPVQPVAICYTDKYNRLDDKAPFVGDDDLLSHLWRFVGSAKTIVHVHALPPLMSAGASRRILADKAHSVIVATLSQYWKDQERRRLP
jgi:1-acyl-sn-glycerol-3-phosphate acyltransferase